MKIKLLLAAAALGFAACAFAFSPSTAEYSADWSIETANIAQQGKIFHAANKERRELGSGRNASVMILRFDRKLILTLMPSERMYMEVPISDKNRDAGDLSGYDVEQTVIGEETVNGVKTTKSKVILKEKAPKTGKMGGFWWMTHDGVMVKLDVISVEKNRKDRLKMELMNLKVGKQEAALFEIPKDYSKMSMPGMNMPGVSMPGLSDMKKIFR